jgi:protein-glucosylgalactosylhydroxylysine glucosidase
MLWGSGHVFWDCATWMYPSILMLYPGIANSILQYRYNRIPGAEEKAQSYVGMNYTGTMFPWESAFTGEETCPSWAATGLREIHISGDIAFATSQYWQATLDLEWLQGPGHALLSGIAEFWVSRTSPGPNGTLSINDVIPPDEYEDHVNNSAYTNAVARLALLAAVDADRTLGMPPASYSKWLEASSLITIPFNATLGIHPEFDNYTGVCLLRQDLAMACGSTVLFCRPNCEAGRRCAAELPTGHHVRKHDT